MSFTPCSICRSPMACRNTKACAENVKLAVMLPPQGVCSVMPPRTPEDIAVENARNYLKGRSDYLSDGDIKLLYNAFCRATGRDTLP